MFLRSFDYVAPTTLDEALAALADAPGAKVLAGGMSLIPMMKLRVLSPPRLVDIGRLPKLRTISNAEVLSVPALARHHEVAAHPEVRRHATALAEAAGWAGDPQVRARGTTCGSVAHADAAADQPAALLALGGQIVVQSPHATRTIPAAEFFLDMFTTALAESEIVTRVELPTAGPGVGSAYAKIGRRGSTEGFPMAAAAAWIRLDAATITDARVALTGVGFRPELAPGAAKAVIGTRGTTTDLAAAAADVLEGVTVLADLHADDVYKAHLARVMTKRALARALERARVDAR